MKTVPQTHLVHREGCGRSAMRRDNRVPEGRGYSFHEFASSHLTKQESKGAALMIVLAFVVLLTGVALAYFTRTGTHRQLAQSSFNDTSADLLARSALDIVVSDFKQEIIDNPTVTTANIQPTRYGDAAIPNLIRRSFSGDPTNRTSGVNSTSFSANGRSINTARWNSHYLIARRPPVPPEDWNTIYSDPVTSFTAPDWVLVTSQGPAPAPAPSAVIGRYAFAVYDEGGVLDMNLAGYPSWSGTVNPNPAPSPTPWLTNVGRKGILTFADLTALPAAPTTTFPQNQIDKIVGWRNWVTTQQPGSASFGSPNFSSGNMRNRQDTWGSYLLDFGVPPYPTPCPFFPFTTVDTSNPPSSGRTDQAVMTRQELLKLRSSLGFSQNVLQYMGTFSRERNQPARDWSRLNNKLPDRFDIGMFSLVKPAPAGAPPSRGKGKGKQRGRYRGDAASILNLFGLQWRDGTGTDPHQVAYWGHWRYVGTPGVPLNDNPHIPALRGGRNDVMQIIDYALTQANAENEDTVNVADIMSLAASWIDQNDDPADDAEPRTGTHVTIIETSTGTSGNFVLGWENGEAPAATDTDPTNPRNPYNWIIDPNTGTTKPRPSGFTPIVLDHAFSTVGDLGYGLRPEHPTNPFQPVDFHTDNPTASFLDFFTYNPVDHNYPRAGIVNLNTKNWPVIAAILQSALKKDIDVINPPTFPTVAPSEAMLAAQDIISATTAQPALTRADIGRLTAAAASRIGNPGYTGEEQEKVPEAIARALSEIGQARTWNLMIDVIAQTGRYPPGATQLVDPNDPTRTQFIVEGEKRYWLHIALGRDLINGQVDVLGTQLEEVIE